LLCRRFLDSHSAICQSFLLVAEPLQLYLGSHYLYLYVPVFTLLFPELVSKSRPYIKVFDPLWTDIYSGQKTWILFQSFTRGCTVFPVTFFEEIVFLPLYILWISVKNQVAVPVGICVWVLYSLPLVFMSIFATVSCRKH
jgi:hypothetical protein